MSDHAVPIPGIADVDVFVSFYERSVAEVFRYFIKGTGGDRRVAEDLTQETFIAAVNAYRAGHVELSMGWLIGVSRHKLVDNYRRQAREERKLTLAWSEQVTRDDGGTVFDVNEAEAFELLAELTPIHRLVLVLRYVDDLAVSEVADAIGRGVHATESILVRARQSLERKLREVSDD